MKKIPAELLRLKLLEGMSRAAASEMIHRICVGDIRKFKKGEVIVYEGTKAKWLVPVLSGSVSVYEPGANGKRHLVRSVMAGHLFGATLVTTRLEYYPGMAVATSDCEVVFFDMAKIRELWYDEKYRKFFENLYTIISEYVHYCWRKMSIMACPKTEDRFMLCLHWHAAETGERDLTVPFSRLEDCARYLGVTRVSLSRAISRLVAGGQIAHPSRGRFVLLTQS